MTACGERTPFRRKVKAEAPAMDFHSIKLPMEYSNEALGGFCHPTSTQIDGIDCMLMYNALIYAVEMIDLTHMKPFRQIKLKEEGRERIGDVRGVFYHQGNFILRTSFGFYRIDGEGNLLAKWSGDEYLKANPSLEGFSIMVPELMMYFNLYNFAGYDERNARMTFSIYKQEKEDGEYPKKILVVDCKSCEVVDVVDVACPERLKREAQLGILGSVNSLPFGDSVIYNFPASAEVFVYNRKDKTTRCHMVLCPPAAAISSARFAIPCPRTSAKSSVVFSIALSNAARSHATGSSRSVPLRCAISCCTLSIAYTRMPSTAAASPAVSAGA